MFPMHGGFMGRGGAPVIPTPEAGVCTVYPIAPPVSGGLLLLCSCFNSCNAYRNNDLTNPVSATNQAILSIDNIQDLSIPYVNVTGGGQAYIDNGSGDVLIRRGGSLHTWNADPTWRFGNHVKTAIGLIKRTTPTSAQTQFGFGASFSLRASAGGFLQVSNSGTWISSLASPINEWQIWSMRADSDIRVGLNKSYETVRSAVTVQTETLGYLGQATGEWRDSLLYDRYLSDVELDQMVDYLFDKWNL